MVIYIIYMTHLNANIKDWKNWKLLIYNTRVETIETQYGERVNLGGPLTN